MITKTLIQTSKEPIPNYVINQMRSWLNNDWHHVTFTNEQMRDYLINNPMEGLDHIVNKFDEFTGAHKSDLFRYYWLYQNGGLFLDSDIMLAVPIERFVQNESFVTAQSVSSLLLCNGILGTIPKHPIMWQALIDAYNTDAKILEDRYFQLCQNLKQIVGNDPNVKIYQERESTNLGIFETFDQADDTVLLYHYALHKVIPPLDQNKRLT